MNQLTKALNEVRPWAGTKSVLPILRNVKLEASNGVLELTTTNLEAVAVTTIPYEFNFATTTNLKKLMAVTKGMTDPITFRVETKQVKNRKGEEATVETLVVSDKDTKATLNAIPVSEFPSTPPKGQHLGELDLSGIERIWPFTANGSRRPILECVLFELGDNARFTAADGFELATMTKDYSGEPATLLIHANSLSKLKRKDMNASVSATKGEVTNYVRFRMNNLALTVTLLEGRYPDWRQIVPKDHDCSLEANVKKWLAALKAVSTFASETHGIVLHTVSEVLTIAAKDGDGNRIERTIPVEQDGAIPPFALGLKHIEATLKACRSPAVTVKLQAETQVETQYEGKATPTTKPLVFEDDTTWQATVMPMHVDGGY